MQTFNLTVPFVFFHAAHHLNDGLLCGIRVHSASIASVTQQTQYHGLT